MVVDGKAVGSGKEWQLEWRFPVNVKAEIQTQQRKMALLANKKTKCKKWLGTGGWGWEPSQVPQRRTNTVTRMLQKLDRRLARRH